MLSFWHIGALCHIHSTDVGRRRPERANENIKSLETEITAFVHPDNYIIIRNIDHEAQECTFTALGQAIPLRFPFLSAELSTICAPALIT